jgi:hypothetical protein
MTIEMKAGGVNRLRTIIVVTVEIMCDNLVEIAEVEGAIALTIDNNRL